MQVSVLKAELLRLQMEEEQGTLPPVIDTVVPPTYKVHYTRAHHKGELLKQDIERDEQHRQLRVMEDELDYDHRCHEAALIEARKDVVAAKGELWTALDEASSDDSDAVDPDFEKEWRDITSSIFSASRAVELRHNDAACDAFVELLGSLRDELLTLTEVQMLWDAVRFLHRNAEPLHSKHWLTHTHELVERGDLRDRVSLVNYLHVLRAAVHCTAFSERHLGKIRRWLADVMRMYHKRVAKLEQFATGEPKWDQVHVTPLDRHEYIPLHPLWRVMELNAERRKIGGEFAEVNASFQFDISAPHYLPPADEDL